MSRVSQQREAEWEFKQAMRRKHEARIRQERISEARTRRWLALLRHQDEFACAQCGLPSAGPWVTPANELLLQPAVIDVTQSANLLRCAVCEGWLCRDCAVYRAGVGRRCRSYKYCRIGV